MSPQLRYDHYKVLGIPRDASVGQIKSAYRDRVKHCHPDRNPSPKAGTVFHAVHEAYRVLSDPGLRDDYDERLRNYRAANSEMHPPPPTQRPFQRTPRPERPPTPVERFAYRGLHVTGLLFGSTLTATSLIGLVFLGWPSYMLALCIPGIAVLPDSIAGLKE